MEKAVESRAGWEQIPVTGRATHSLGAAAVPWGLALGTLSGLEGSGSSGAHT